MRPARNRNASFDWDTAYQGQNSSIVVRFRNGQRTIIDDLDIREWGVYFFYALAISAVGLYFYYLNSDTIAQLTAKPAPVQVVEGDAPVGDVVQAH